VADEPYWLEEAPAKITAEQRERWMKAGFTLSKTDDSWPIPNLSFLQKAINSWGRAVTAGNTAQVKRHILKHARRLGASKEKIAQIQKLGTKESAVKSSLPIANRDFRIELGRALVEDTAFARDMTVAAAKALSGDPLQEAERSHDQTRQAVHQALRDQYRQGDDDFGPWIREIYDDKVVFEHDGDTFQSSYTIDDDENVTLGDRTEVEIQYVPVVKPATESGIGEEEEIPTDMVMLREAVVPLLEKALRRDDTAPVKLIAPGRGSSGFYSPEVLERDGPEAFPQGTKMYWNHPTEKELEERPERDLRDLAAELVSDARYEEEGTDGPGLYADAKVFGDFKEAVDELAPHIGLSIHAGGFVNEDAAGDDGQDGVVERIYSTVGNSVDFVTLPGAGGKVVELFESARGRGKPPAPRKEEDMAEATDLKEANSRLTEAERKLQEAEQERDAEKKEKERLQEALVIRDAREKAAGIITEIEKEATIRLPDGARNRVLETEAVSKNPPTKDDGTLDEDALKTSVAEAVKAEAKYLAEVTGSGQISGMGPSEDGDGDGEGGDSKLSERLEKGFEKLGLSESAAKTAAKGRS
jgi:hypothetical protein